MSLTRKQLSSAPQTMHDRAGDDALRARPNLEAELVAGMRRHDIDEADICEALGLDRNGLERLVASPHLADPRLVADFRHVVGPRA